MLLKSYAALYSKFFVLHNSLGSTNSIFFVKKEHISTSFFGYYSMIGREKPKKSQCLKIPCEIDRPCIQSAFINNLRGKRAHCEDCLS